MMMINFVSCHIYLIRVLFSITYHDKQYLVSATTNQSVTELFLTKTYAIRDGTSVF